VSVRVFVSEQSSFLTHFITLLLLCFTSFLYNYASSLLVVAVGVAYVRLVLQPVSLLYCVLRLM